MSEHRRVLLNNFLSLSSLQCANYVLPLITLPYLVRVLGTERFGLIAFAQVFTQWFVMLTDYGFNLSATREISIHRGNHAKVSEIFTSVMFIKLGLLILSFSILCGVVYSVSRFRVDWNVYLLTFGGVIGQALFPVWFFQGIERMKYIAVLNVLSKLVFTFFVFFLIKDVSDYWLVPLINSSGFCISGLLSQIIARKIFGMRIYWTALRGDSLRKYLYDGFPVFVSLVSSTVLYTLPTILIGFVLGYSIAGIYSLAEKIVTALKGIIVVLNQTMYPYLARLFSENKRIYFLTWRKFFKLSLSVSGLLFFFLLMIPQKLVVIVFSEEYILSLTLLKFLAITLVCHSLINSFGLLGLLVLGRFKQLVYSQVIPGLFFLVLSPFVLKFGGLYVFILFFIFTEVQIVIFRVMYLRRMNFFHFHVVHE